MLEFQFTAMLQVKENTMEKQDLSTWIEGTEDRSRMSVDIFDENGVWVSMVFKNGRTNMVINKDGAKDLIAALIRIVDEME
jgi:hypothetical protein